MTSPFTGGEVKLCEEPRTMIYRKEQYNYIHKGYLCVDTGMLFTDTELDAENLEQVHSQYRVVVANEIVIRENSTNTQKIWSFCIKNFPCSWIRGESIPSIRSWRNAKRSNW